MHPSGFKVVTLPRAGAVFIPSKSQNYVGCVKLWQFQIQRIDFLRAGIPYKQRDVAWREATPPATDLSRKHPNSFQVHNSFDLPISNAYSPISRVLLQRSIEIH